MEDCHLLNRHQLKVCDYNNKTACDKTHYLRHALDSEFFLRL